MMGLPFSGWGLACMVFGVGALLHTYSIGCHRGCFFGIVHRNRGSSGFVVRRPHLEPRRDLRCIGKLSRFLHPSCHEFTSSLRTVWFEGV